MRRVEGPWRALCQLKKPYKGPRQRRGSCWEELQRRLFPRPGVIDFPPGTSMIFLQKGNRQTHYKNWVGGHWPDLGSKVWQSFKSDWRKYLPGHILYCSELLSAKYPMKQLIPYVLSLYSCNVPHGWYPLTSRVLLSDRSHGRLQLEGGFIVVLHFELPHGFSLTAAFTHSVNVDIKHKTFCILELLHPFFPAE